MRNAVVVVTLLAMCGGLWYLARARNSTRYRFHFHLTDGCVYSGTEQWSGNQRFPGSTHAYSARIRTEYRVSREDGDYIIAARPTYVKALVDGRDRPTYTTMLRSPYTYRIDRGGRVTGLTLPPEFDQKITAALAKTYRGSVYPGMQQVYRECYEQTSRTGWLDTVGVYLGRSVRIGDTWTATAHIDFPDGTSVGVPVQYRAAECVRREGRDCLRIHYAFRSDPACVAKAYAAQRPAGASRLVCRSYSLEGEMVVDPDGIRIISDTSTDKLVGSMTSPWAKESCSTAMRDTLRFAYPPQPRAKRGGT